MVHRRARHGIARPAGEASVAARWRGVEEPSGLLGSRRCASGAGWLVAALGMAVASPAARLASLLGGAGLRSRPACSAVVGAPAGWSGWLPCLAWRLWGRRGALRRCSAARLATKPAREPRGVVGCRDRRGDRQSCGGGWLRCSVARWLRSRRPCSAIVRARAGALGKATASPVQRLASLLSAAQVTAATALAMPQSAARPVLHTATATPIRNLPRHSAAAEAKPPHSPAATPFLKLRPGSNRLIASSMCASSRCSAVSSSPERRASMIRVCSSSRSSTP